MKKSLLLIIAAALFCAAFVTSCWDVNPDEDPIIAIYVQSGTLTAGASGTATFVVLTANIDNSHAGSVRWFTDLEGTSSASAPAGVSASLSTGNEQRTLTVSTTPDSQEGIYYFRVTIDDASSNVAMLTIGESTTKSVSVGAQDGQIMAGIPSSTRFSITTANITTSEAGTVQWYPIAVAINPIDAPAGVSTSISVGGINRSLIVSTTNSSVAGTYYFTVTIDGVQSNIGTLEISAIPERSVTVGQASNQLPAGEEGEVKYEVVTENIAVSHEGTIQWYSDYEGLLTSDAPAGISASVSTGETTRTMLLTATTNTQMGVYYFRITIDRVTSNVGMLTIHKGVEKIVEVKDQEGALNAGEEGNAKFPVETTNIAVTMPGTIQWYSDAGGTTTTNAPAGISAAISTGETTRTMLVDATTSTEAGNYYFRVTIDGITSNVGILTINRSTTPAKTVWVEDQEGEHLKEGTPGEVKFPVITENIDVLRTGTIQWYYDPYGTDPASVPMGISISISTGSTTRTMLVTANSSTQMGEYYFRVTIDGVTSNVGTLFIDKSAAPQKAVWVDDQEGMLYAGEEGNAKFPVITDNIAVTMPGTIQWYSNAGGTSTTNAPAGISAVISTGETTRTMFVTANSNTQMGDYYFRVTIDGITSNVGMLSINRSIPPPKSVEVKEQEGTITAGEPGSVTFPVITENIATTQTGTVQWYANINGTNPIIAPAGISTTVSTGSANRTLTVNTGMDTAEGYYYFRVTIDGITSNMGILTIIKSIPPEKYIEIPGPQQGKLQAGVKGSVATFEVFTKNIDPTKEGKVNWYDSTGTKSISDPQVLGVVISTGDEKRILTAQTIGPDSNEGDYFFRVEIDGVESNLRAFEIR